MRLLIGMVLVLCLVSCQRREDRQCLKFTGKEAVKRLDLAEFRALSVGPRVAVDLFQDSINFIEIIGGENLLNFIETDIKNHHLKIRNANKCNYLRSQKDKVRLEVHYRDLDSVFLNSSEDVRMINTLKNKYFYADFNESSGHFFVNVNV
ncbi:MAG: DUF2807 domain-containing protein, partial [Bacteroidetes bacterium]|nr:DUF2807 domain-containing protein [Bacteroidota bacterium]